MAFTSETKKELENYISGHLPNKEWYESHFYPFIENKSLRDRLIVEFINARKIYKFFEGLQASDELELGLALLVSGLNGSFNLGDGLGIRLRNNQRYAVLRCTSIDGFRLPDVGIRPTSVRTSDYLHRIVDFYILVHLIFLHKISFCIVHCRTFIALRHERWFTLRLFNIGGKQLIESGFAKTLLHGSDTKELLFI